MIVNDVKKISLKEFKKLKETYFDLVREEDFLVDYIDGKKFQTEYEFYQYFKPKYCFGSHFGHNWDAFADCMKDLMFWDDKQGFIIVLYNFKYMFSNHLEYKEIIVDCFQLVANFLDNEVLTTSGGCNHLKSFDVYLVDEDISL